MLLSSVKELADQTQVRSMDVTFHSNQNASIISDNPEGSIGSHKTQKAALDQTKLVRSSSSEWSRSAGKKNYHLDCSLKLFSG